MRTLLAGLACLLFLSTAQAQVAPTVLWHSSPASAGQTVLLFGDGFGPDATVGVWPAGHDQPPAPGRPAALPTGPGQPLEVRGRSRSDCLMVGLPAGPAPAVYLLRVASGGRVSEPVVLNRPRVEWWLGDQAQAVSPGAALRIFGRELRLTAPGTPLRREDATPAGWGGKVVLVDAAGQSHALAVTVADAYCLTATVPADLPPGPAQVYVHNGYGGAWGWAEPVTVPVAAPQPWPQTVYNVHSFGATGDGQADDTLPVQAALQAAAQAGGGVVLLPRGTYKLTAQLHVPPRTVVRGEGPEATWLYVPDTTPEFNTVFSGSGDFALEGFWLSAQTTRRLVAAPDQASMYAMPWGGPPRPDTWAHNVRLSHLRLHHLRYAHRVAPTDPRRKEDVGPSTVVLCGSNLRMDHCDIVSSGMPLVLMNSSRSLITDNVLGVGRNGWYGLWGCRELCFEGNEIVGRDLEASYGGFNGDEVARVYFADNHLHGSFGDEREATTFDTPGRYPWVGSVAAGTADTVTAAGLDKPWGENSLVGLGCVIIKGRGLGQMRQITGNTADKLTLDRPWQLPPDASSAIAVRPYRTQVTLYRNYSEDTSVGVQLWAGGYDYIVDGNTSVRTGGLWGCAGHYQAWGQDHFEPVFFTQWLNNRVEQGFIYQQGPSLFACLGLFAMQTARAPGVDATALLANVIRDNSVSDHTEIGLFYYGSSTEGVVLAAGMLKGSPFGEPPGRATLIEDNAIANSPVGVEIQPYFADTVVRGSRCTQVAKPLEDMATELPQRIAAGMALRDKLEAQPGPILWYSFDQLRPDGTVPNQAGDYLPMRPVGTLVREAGKVGQAARFDGHFYLQAGEVGDLHLLALNLPRYTVSCWIKPDTVQGRWGLVVRRLAGAETPLVFTLYNGGLALDATDDQAKWSFNSGTGPCVKAGEWQHVAVTVDQDKGVDFYVNGLRVGGRAVTGKLCACAEPVILGREQWGGNPPNGQTPGYYTGLLDEVKMWARALSPEEIRTEAGLP